MLEMARTRLARRFCRDQKAVAAVEFAGVAMLLIVAGLNVTDMAIYAYQRMQIENAAAVGAQAAAKLCDEQKLPALSKCTGLTAAITAAVQSTSLGNSVTIASGYPAEGYYCVNDTNELELVGSIADPRPVNCSAAGTPSLTPGDYIEVRVSAPYAPLFGNLSAGSLFATPVVATAHLRLM